LQNSEKSLEKVEAYAEKSLEKVEVCFRRGKTKELRVITPKFSTCLDYYYYYY